MNTLKIKLLLVDDNPLDAALTQRLLQMIRLELPVDTVWVDNAEKALHEIQNRPYDLLLLDYQLPGASGLDVLAELHKLPRHQQPAVIMLTASGSERVAVEAMKSGARDYIRKDELAAAPLTRALMSALSQKRLQDQVDQYVSQTKADLRMARQLQHAMLPHHFPTFPPQASPAETALRFHARYISTTELGGDFYDVFPVSDSEAGIFICDVMGHGVRAALLTAMIRALVEELMPQAGDPGHFIQGINHGFHSILRDADEPLFATAFYLIVDIAKGQMRFSNAGHPPPFYVSKAKGHITPLAVSPPESGAALGFFDDQVYTTSTLPCCPKDRIILFTDGVFEVIGPGNSEFGIDRLQAVFQARLEQPLPYVFDAVTAETKAFSTDGEYADDICLIGVEIERLME